MKYRVDNTLLRKDELILSGWAIGETAQQAVTFCLEDRKKNQVPMDLVRLQRTDIRDACFPGSPETDFGFQIRFNFKKAERYVLFLYAGEKKRSIHIDPEAIRKEKGHENRLSVRLRKYANPDRFQDVKEALIEDGLGNLIKRSREKLFMKGFDYNDWMHLHALSRSDLREKMLLVKEDPAFFLYPVGDVLARYQQQMLVSCYEQLLRPSGIYDSKSGKIQILNTEAVNSEDNSWIVFLDSDMILSREALLELAGAAAEDPAAELLYCDEDCVRSDGRRYCMPYFKPDFNRELLYSGNYIGGFFAVRVSLWKKIQLEEKKTESFQEASLQRILADQAAGWEKNDGDAFRYDILLRCLERTGHFLHVPGAFVHRRYHGEKVSYRENLPDSVLDAEKNFLREHLLRIGRRADVTDGMVPGTFRVHYRMKKAPLISILIPTKDHTDDLDLCLSSLLKSSYRNFEVILIENNSTDPKTFAYYEEAEKKYSFVRLVTWKDGFNFAAINNYGSAFARGEYLVFMNNDVELLTPDLLTEMLSFFALPDVGLVGCRLLYPDDTIQHAGVIVGMSGLADHAFQGFNGKEEGNFYRPLMTQEFSAVTAACMMMKKQLFLEIGEFDESLIVAFNDTDLCMKVRAAGKRIIYTPYACLHHYESKSRGVEDTPEKKARLEREISRFKEKWPEILEKGDPCFNPWLNPGKQDFSLKP